MPLRPRDGAWTIRVGDPAGAELDLAIVEIEVRHVDEAAIGRAAEGTERQRGRFSFYLIIRLFRYDVII